MRICTRGLWAGQGRRDASNCGGDDQHKRAALILAHHPFSMAKHLATFLILPSHPQTSTPFFTSSAFVASNAQCFSSSSITLPTNFYSISHTRKLRLANQVVYRRARVACSLVSQSQTFPSLKDLPVNPYIDADGNIRPPVEPGIAAAATVFAVYDNKMKVQYIGFSKDVRNSLRTLMGRRPELCHFYKLYNLSALDQKQLLAIRQQWISELGSTPRGNSDVTQKNLWEKPVDAGSISDSGKASAAAAKAKMLLQTLLEKGLKEQMVYDPALMEQGKCDILPIKDSSKAEQPHASSGPVAEARSKKQIVINAPTGETVEYEILYEGKYKTNGGWMFDIAVTKDDKETRHRVICGRIFPEAANMPEDTFVETVIGFLLHKKVPRHTEGLRASNAFPINYFAVGEVSQRFEDFKSWFTEQLPDVYMRCNKLYSYGAMLDPPPPVGPENNVSTIGKKVF